MAKCKALTGLVMKRLVLLHMVLRSCRIGLICFLVDWYKRHLKQALVLFDFVLFVCVFLFVCVLLLLNNCCLGFYIVIRLQFDQLDSF